jgi:serine/threonine-protein kinase RsbT
MSPVRAEIYRIHSSEDVVLVRQAVRTCAVQLGFSLVDQTKIATAASELARNTIVHGGGGEMRLETLRERRRQGIRLTFEDKGEGIPDLELALKDGYTSKSGLGLGLGGAKRLSNDFEIWSVPGEGTRVSITRWKL